MTSSSYDLRRLESAHSPARSRRYLLLALCGLFLAATLLGTRHSVHKRGMDALTAMAYRMDPELRGRVEQHAPAATCCTGTACARGARGRVAVVTYIRDEKYFPLFQQLECTLRRSNPGLELAAMVVEGELGPAVLARMRALNVTFLPVAPLEIANSYEPRFAKNWLKLRALELGSYDAVLLVDADVAVIQDVSELFALPAAFAAVLDQPGWLNQEKTGVEMFQGGVFFLRPCAATARHMQALVAAHAKLRFVHGNAEQEFFTWYFRHTAWTLPMEYNTMTHPSLRGNRTVGGVAPKILHFTSNKPFGGPQAGSLGHEFLCSTQALAARLRARVTAAKERSLQI